MPLKLILPYLILVLPQPNYIKYSFLILSIFFFQSRNKMAQKISTNSFRELLNKSCHKLHYTRSCMLKQLLDYTVKTSKLFICGKQVCWSIMVKIWLFVCTTNKRFVTSLSYMQPSAAVYWGFIDEKPKDWKGSPLIWCSNLKQKILMFNQVTCFAVNT